MQKTDTQSELEVKTLPSGLPSSWLISKLTITGIYLISKFFSW